MINDHFGHLAGDAVLKEASERMRSCIRDSDTLARVGDDEFIILLPTIEGEQDAITVGKKILQVMSSPIDFEGQALHSSASVGITVYPDHGLDENKLINNADVAMYSAKASGKNAIQVFGEPVIAEVINTLG
ncbi:MAG TPA: hypothetical protein DCW35_02165 [Polynucleobacter sp.]|nr:hypothetical protein [Polynucleobacter sp.]